jgi:hypothetical protein
LSVGTLQDRRPVLTLSFGEVVGLGGSNYFSMVVFLVFAIRLQNTAPNPTLAISRNARWA